MSKRGKLSFEYWIILAIIILMVISFGYAIFTWESGEKADKKSLSDLFKESSSDKMIPYEKIFFQKYNTKLENQDLMKYVFGGVPQILDDFASKESGAIIMLGIWFILFFSMLDIFNLFGNFQTHTNVLIAFVLTVTLTVTKILTYFVVFLAIIASAFAGFAIFVTIFMIFVIFLLFNFGTNQFRNWVVGRRLQEIAMRQQFGRQNIASGARAMADVGRVSAE